MDKYQAYKVFVSVSEKLSFSKAAEALNLPNASVSTIIQDLESTLGVRLLERTTRRVSLTPEGSNFLERCKQMINDVDEAESMFRNEPTQIKGKIRVEMSVGAASLVIPLLPEFFEKYPDLEVELSSRDYFVDLMREGIDCALRSGGSKEPELIEKEIGEIVCVNCASPAYINRYGKPKHLDDLKNHRLVLYTHTFGSKSHGFEYFDGAKSRIIKMKTAIAVNSITSYSEACRAGLGLAQLPLIGARKAFKDGTLIEVLPKFRPEPYKLKLIYHERRLLSHRVRIFMDWLEKVLKERLR